MPDFVRVIEGMGSLEFATYLLVFLIIVAVGIVVVIEWADRWKKDSRPWL